MRKGLILVAIILCAAIFSCTAQRETEANITEVEVQYHEAALEASSFLKSEGEQQLQFQETDSTGFYRHINRVLFAADRIFLVDEPTDRVISFDEEGHFVGSTARLIGKGHNEYLSLLDASLDTASRRIYACCDAPLSLFVLDYDFNVDSIILLDRFLKEIVSDDHYVYGLSLSNLDDVKAELLVYDKHNLFATPKTLLSTKKGVSGLLTIGNMLTYGDDGILACLPYENSIVKIKDGEIVTAYRIDFGQKTLHEYEARNATASEVIKNHSDKNWLIVNACESDSTLLFNTNTGYTFVVNKKNGLCQSYQFLDNNLSKYFGPQIVSAQNLPKQVIYRSSAVELFKPMPELRAFFF